MIKSLDIHNYALIDNLSIKFDKGFNIITGETGSGKSIMLGAMGLIMGKRAETKVLFSPDQKCVVEAKFAIEEYKLQDFFNENDLDYSDELIIRREINPTGKSRAFINDTPSTLEVLQELANQLVDLHQQFDTLDIHKPSFQLEIVDAMANNAESLKKYHSLYTEYKALERSLNKLKDLAKNQGKEEDFLRFQFKELSEANLVKNEKSDLEAQLEILSNAEDIKRIAGLIAATLTENENSISDQLIELNRELGQISAIDKRYTDLQNRLLAILEETKDIGHESTTIHDETEFDQQVINTLQDRLSLIYRLEKKHGVSSTDDLIAIQDQLHTSLKSIMNNDEEISKIESEIKKSKEKLEKLANEISEKRRKASPIFVKNVEALLTSLAMENARLDIRMNKCELNATGNDELTFYFSANKGSDFKLLKDVASGGEISRLTLVMKSIVANAIKLPTMIFDEIDTGISGEVAHKMGNILTDLSKNHQVICITHSPQISAKADTHFFVFKEEIKGKTVSAIKTLDLDGRINELAKMLSGNPPTPSAIKNAKELLNR